MTMMRILILAFAGLQLPATAMAQEPDIVVRADVARAEIERILAADNLDTASLSPREVADMLVGIERGSAPEDFWNAYEQHVEAWQNLAAEIDQLQQSRSDSALFPDEELERAEGAI